MNRQRLVAWARRLKDHVVAVHHAARDPRTPWFARFLALAVVAYAASPIDLIPDFIPVLGLLDDLILVPLGLMLAVRLIPPEVLAEHRQRVMAGERLPANRLAAIVIVLLWILGMLGCVWWLWQAWPG